jgi:hypothetical protein
MAFGFDGNVMIVEDRPSSMQDFVADVIGKITAVSTLNQANGSMEIFGDNKQI